MARHLLACPHCNKPGIGLWAKYRARPFEPAVCQNCDRASSISDAVESVSALIYFIAGFFALGFFAMHLLSSRSNTPIFGPSPITLLISLLVFYVAVEAAKMFWVPMKALSDPEVARKKSTSNKISIGIVIVFFTLVLLGKCGF